MKKTNLNLLLKLLFFLPFVFVTIFLNAQVKTRVFKDSIPQSQSVSKAPIRNVIQLEPPADFEQLKNAQTRGRDSRSEKSQFAASLLTEIDFITVAEKRDENGFATFSLTIIARQAMNVSLEFSNFELSPNSVLSIFTKRELTDSITSNQNNQNKVWATRVYQGNSLSIVLKLPISEIAGSSFRISKVNFGFKPYGMEYGNQGASAGCHFNVACTQGTGWENERNSVSMIVANGVERCTGALIMNTCNTNVPYLLTANHCLAAGNVTNWVFQFQYWSTTCTPDAGWNEDVQFNGCVLRANHAASDFALLQLNQTPAPGSNLRYAGWSTQTTGNTSTTILHHPAGDLMKVSVDNGAPVTATFDGIDSWQLDLDEGATEDGTSGAPYFNQDHRIIAQHYGTGQILEPICNRTEKYGGRFHLSWNGGGTNATRLSNWLDPNSTGATTTNTTNVSNLLPASLSLSITGGLSTICSGQSTYTLNGAPAGVQIIWQISNPSIAQVAANGNQATVTKTGNGTIGLTATVGGNCFTNNVAIKTIRLGTYITSEYNITQWPSSVCLNQTVQFGMPWYYYPPEPGTTYNWTWSGLTYISGQGTSVITLRAPSSAPFSTPWVIGRANNSCGSGPMSPAKYLVLNTGCWSPYRVSPNPTSDFIKIETAADNALHPKGRQPVVTEVQIIDKMGLVRLKKAMGKALTPITIRVSHLPTDIYTLRIFDGQNWYSHKISIQR